MKRTFHAVLLALFLAAIGLGIFIHKLTASDVPLLPNQAFNSWYVEAKLSLDSQPLPLSGDEDLPSTIQFHLPLICDKLRKSANCQGGRQKKVK